MCVRNEATPETRASLSESVDLSALKWIQNGAEPIRASSVSPRLFRPCSGTNAKGSIVFYVCVLCSLQLISLTQSRASYGLFDCSGTKQSCGIHHEATMNSFKGCQRTSSPGTSHFGFSCPWDWRDAVISGPQIPWELAEHIPFRLRGTLGTGGTQSFQAPRYPGDWRDSVLSGSRVLRIPWELAELKSFQPPRTLGTGETQSSQPPKCPGDWRDSVISRPRVPCGLV